MSGDYERITYAGGHIDVRYGTYCQVQRIDGEITTTPVYDRAYLRIHARGDDGFLGTDMTPADAHALLKAVRQRCPDMDYPARLANAHALQAALAAELDGLSETDAANVMAPFLEPEQRRHM